MVPEWKEDKPRSYVFSLLALDCHMASMMESKLATRVFYQLIWKNASRIAPNLNISLTKNHGNKRIINSCTATYHSPLSTLVNISNSASITKIQHILMLPLGVLVIFQSRGCFDNKYTLQISETVKRNTLVHIWHLSICICDCKTHARGVTSNLRGEMSLLLHTFNFVS